MIYLTISFSIIILILGYVVWNLLRKTEKLEDICSSQQKYLEKVSSVITFIDNRIQELDKDEAFSSDDEIGFFFQRVKMLNDLLKQYDLSYENNQNQDIK